MALHVPRKFYVRVVLSAGNSKGKYFRVTPTYISGSRVERLFFPTVPLPEESPVHLGLTMGTFSRKWRD